VLKDTPCFAAITLVAPGERFNALEILDTPAFDLAIVFNVRMSSFDHARRTTFFFLAKSRFLFLRTGLVAREDDLARQRDLRRSATLTIAETPAQPIA
jgi:hypothetical protein